MIFNDAKPHYCLILIPRSKVLVGLYLYIPSYTTGTETDSRHITGLNISYDSLLKIFPGTLKLDVI